MKNRILPAMLFMLFATVANAQNNDHKMTETQKADAAKADVYITSGKKITDTFTVTKEDSAAVIKKSKKRSCKNNKKSS